MADVREAAGRNAILSSLALEDFDLLHPHLELVILPLRHRFETKGRKCEHVAFVLSGMISVVASAADGEVIEVGVVGREGMTGFAVFMKDHARSQFDVFCQLPGEALQISAATLHDLAIRRSGLQNPFVGFAYDFIIQLSRSVIANGRAKLEARLARWLLMVDDRVSGEPLGLTHEFLSQMLGVRRPGVTMAVNFLEQRGLIVTGRGMIEIVDRAGLETAANGFYDHDVRA